MFNVAHSDFLSTFIVQRRAGMDRMKALTVVDTRTLIGRNTSAS